VCGLVLHLAVPLAQEPRVRVIVEQGGVPIPSRLLPDDELVVIKPLFPVQTLPPARTATERLRTAVAINDAAAVIDVSAVEGFFNEKQTWIRTRITGRVVESLMSKKTSLRVGSDIQVEYFWSGEMKIGKVLVRAGEPLAIESRRRYLIFLLHDPDGVAWALGSAPIQVVGGKLVNPSQAKAGSTTRDLWHGLAYADFAKQVRRLVRDLKIK
jgi:hypothetical protein